MSPVLLRQMPLYAQMQIRIPNETATSHFSMNHEKQAMCSKSPTLMTVQEPSY